MDKASLYRTGVTNMCLIAITETQKKIFGQIKEFILEHSPANPGQLHFPANLKARDRRFVEVVAKEFNLHFATEYSNEDNSKHVYIEFEENEEGEEDASEEEIDEEALAARDRVLAKYENARVIKDELTEEELSRIEQEKYEADHKEWKRQYYWVSKTKFTDVKIIYGHHIG